MAKTQKLTHFLKNLVSLYWMTKIKTRKYCCLYNLGSIQLNNVNTKNKNIFACYSIKWQKNTKHYLLIENSTEDQNTWNNNILLLGSMLLNNKNTKRKEILLWKTWQHSTWNENILLPEEPYFLFWMIRT